MATWQEYVPDWAKPALFDASAWWESWEVPNWFSQETHTAGGIDQEWIDQVERDWARQDAIKAYGPWLIGAVVLFGLWRVFVK